MTSTESTHDRLLVRATRRLTVEVFDGADLKSAGWPSIAAGADLKMHVFQSAEFLDVWMATIGKARAVQCFLIVVRDRHRRPVLYLPLTIETKFNIRFLRFIDGGVVDFNGPILVAGQELSRDEFRDVWADILFLLPEFDLIDLQKITGHVSNVRNPLTYLECSNYRSSGHAIHWSSQCDEPDRSRSKIRMRKKLRRQQQRLDEIGTTELVISPAASRASEIMDALIDLKRRQYLRTTGSDFFAKPGVQDFYRAMAMPDRLGRVSHLSALICGGKILAAHLGFIGRGRFYYVLPAFDTEYRSFATGLLLLDHLVESSRGEFATFDLGEGDSSYKEKWATHELPLWSCEQAKSAAGMLYRPLRRVRQFVDGGHFTELYGMSRTVKTVKQHAV